MENYIVIGIAVYLIAFAFVMKTNNFVSSLLFKVIPFFSGMFLLYHGLRLLGVFH